MKLYITPSSSSQIQGVPMIPLKITRVQNHNKQSIYLSFSNFNIV